MSSKYIRQAVRQFRADLGFAVDSYRWKRRLKLDFSAHEQRISHDECKSVEQRLSRILNDNILPFWYPHVIDQDQGGYLLNHDEWGVWLGPCNKGIVSQARTLWFFSQLAEQTPDNPGYLDAAHSGFSFLKEHLWDDVYGGFFWEVDHQSGAPSKPDKHTYGQSFGLYALCAYAKVTGCSSAKSLATELFDLLEHNCRDTIYGGYREFLRRDWCEVPDSTLDYRNDSAPSRKTQDTHLHLLESFTSYVELTNNALAKKRLSELVVILTSTIQRHFYGVGTDVHDQSWQPLPVQKYMQVLYGHELEKIWLLTKACSAIDIAPALLISVYRSWFSVAYDKAFDKYRGGFFDRGDINRHAHTRHKTWWTQAEGLLAAMQMFVHTREYHFYACFCQSLDWIEKNQVDWTNGDWHRTVELNGKFHGHKADNWKTPYHNGRAMIECLNLLRQID